MRRPPLTPGDRVWVTVRGERVLATVEGTSALGSARVSLDVPIEVARGLPVKTVTRAWSDVEAVERPDPSRLYESPYQPWPWWLITAFACVFVFALVLLAIELWH